MAPVQQKKIKYARPCDKCSFRKIKCDRMMPCSGCMKLNLKSSNEREIKKRGPKSTNLKTSGGINPMCNTFTNKDSIKCKELSPNSKHEYFQPRITMCEFLPFLEIYQNWYYDIWPVISVDQLITSISSKKNKGKIELNQGNIQSYVLCCALAGTIKDIINLVSFYDKLVIPSDIEKVDFIGECLRARNFCDYKSYPTLDTILASFFLFIYHTDAKFNFLQAVLYLREAIAITEVLDLSKRSTSILTNIPIVLVETTLADGIDREDYPKLNGFSEIVKIFTLPDTSFFTNKPIATKRKTLSKQLILKIDMGLANIHISDDIHQKQKLNIILTQNWMRLFIWNTCRKNNQLDFFENDFPITLAIDLLSRTNDIPMYAFESNGPGICSKLLEISEKISLVINDANLNAGYNTLMSIFNIISLLKANIVSNKTRQRIQMVLQSDALVLVPMSLSFYHSASRATPVEKSIEINSITGMNNDIETSIDMNTPCMENISQYSPISYFNLPFTDSTNEKTPFNGVSEMSSNIQVINDREEDKDLRSHQYNNFGKYPPVSQSYSNLGQLCSYSSFSQPLIEYKFDATSDVALAGVDDIVGEQTEYTSSFTICNFLGSVDR